MVDLVPATHEPDLALVRGGSRPPTESIDVSRKPTVVIVDDDDDFRAMVSLLLRRAGFEVVGEARNGLDAVAVATEHQPDVVVLDWRMPALAGDRSAPLIRAGAPGAWIVAVSAYLERVPEWADLYVGKENLQDMPMVIEGLVQRGARSRR